jgi:hypothetical protein
LLRDITVARIFWLSQSEERKNSAKPKKWPSMIRNVSLLNGQTDRLALPYKFADTLFLGRSSLIIGLGDLYTWLHSILLPILHVWMY